MHCRLSGVCLAFTLLSVPIPTTFGQTEKTTLRGTVSDPTGAVIPGATVIVTELATKPSYNPEKQGFRQIDLKLRVQW